MLDDADGDTEGYEDDTTSDEPKASAVWLEMIDDAEKVFKPYQDHCDKIDKLYASLEKLSAAGRDRQFQMFWANIQVLGPSCYARPPIPVVVPKFRDRKALLRVTSELLERCAVVGFESEDMDGVMRLIRDDLTISARGAIWLRYEAKGDERSLTERVCVEHTDRKDFLHQPARKWKEVDWVAKRSWLTKAKMKTRFQKTSKDAYLDAAYEVRKDDKGAKSDDGEKRAGVWELWCKSENKVVWITEGVDVVLDEGEPHLTLEDFFPCPRPAYSTVERRSLVPVPDFAFYKDQLEEINELTARIAALAQALKVRGFYPAGASDLSDAIQAAVKATTDNQVLVPVSNWSMVGSGGVKDMIVWLPLDMISTTIVELVNLRKQVIEDVYEITGLSDIMRGATNANETLGAQQLKSQYGSIRIRDRQDELVRIARDTARITAEIIAENFSSKTIVEMSQMEIATNADIAKQVKGIEQQVAQITQKAQQAQASPQIQQAAQQNPEQAQQFVAQAQQQIEGMKAQIAKLNDTPTIEKVIRLLRDQKLRPFVLDIETDSTIAPDENAQKQRATEFMTAVGGYMQQAFPLVQEMPQAAPMAAEFLKFIASQFRVGREMEGVIDEFADKMATMAGQQKGPSPEQMKAQADAKAAESQLQLDAQELQHKTQTEQIKEQNRHAEIVLKAQGESERHKLDMERARLASLTSIEVARIGAKVDTDSALVSSQLEALLGFAKMSHDAGQAEQDRIHEKELADTAAANQQNLATQGQAHDQTMAAQAAANEPADA